MTMGQVIHFNFKTRTRGTTMIVNEEQLERFRAAAKHKFSCECDYCEEWWEYKPEVVDEKANVVLPFRPEKGD